MVMSRHSQNGYKSYTVAAVVVGKKEAVSCNNRRYWVQVIFKERQVFGEYTHLIENVLNDEDNT